MITDLMRTDSTPVTDGKLKTVSLVVDGLSLTKGTDYSVSVTATNSIGESKPVMGTLSVPSECVALFHVICVHGHHTFTLSITASCAHGP